MDSIILMLYIRFIKQIHFFFQEPSSVRGTLFRWFFYIHPFTRYSKISITDLCTYGFNSQKFGLFSFPLVKFFYFRFIVFVPGEKIRVWDTYLRMILVGIVYESTEEGKGVRGC